MTVQPRNTRQKAAIRSAIIQADRPLSPEEIWDAARQTAASISIATVYRNIVAFVEEKWLAPIDLPGQSTRYEVAGKAHHHHFQCNTCGKLYELPGCSLQTLPKLPRGYRVTGHEFFLYGTCNACT